MPKPFEQEMDTQKTEEPKEQDKQQVQETQTQEPSEDQSAKDSQEESGPEAGESAQAQKAKQEEQEKRRRDKEDSRSASEIRERLRKDSEKIDASKEFTNSYSDSLMQIHDIETIKEKRMDVLIKKQELENVKFRLIEQFPKQLDSIESPERREHIEHMIDRRKSRVDRYMEKLDQCLKFNSDWVVTVQYENLSKRVEKLDEDRKKDSLADPGDESKGMKGGLSAKAYKRFNNARLFYQAELDALPSPAQESAIEKRRHVEELLGQLNTALDTYKNSLSDGEKMALEIIDKEGQDAEEQLNSTYKDGAPLVRLIRKAAALEHTQDAGKEEEDDWTEKYEKAMEAVEFINDATKSDEEKKKEEEEAKEAGEEEPPDLKEWLKDHAKTALGWLLGQIGVSEAVHSVTSAAGKFNELFAPLISLGKLIGSYKEFFANKKDMGEDEKVIEAKALGNETLEHVMSGVEKIGDVAGGIPYIGAIFGIIRNMVAMGYSIHQAIVSGRRKNEMDKSKEALKQKMFEKRAKYQTDSLGLRDQNLFGFMGYQKEKDGFFDRKKSARAYHVSKNGSKKRDEKDILVEGNTTFEKQKQDLESKVGGEGLHDNIMAMKEQKNRGELSEEERVKYYQMKSLATMRQYDETKSAKETNKDRIRQSIGTIVESSVSLLANISGLVPGLGPAISYGSKVILKIGKSGASLFGKIKNTLAEAMDLPSSKSNQEKHRSAMGRNMYEQMVSVSRFLKPEGSTERDGEGGAEKPVLFDVKPTVAKRVSKQMNYLDGLFRGLSTRYTKIMAAESENSMVGKLGESFTKGGAQ